MNTTVRHEGSKRSIEIPLEAWGKHWFLIEKWCGGEDVQLVIPGGAGNGIDYHRDVLLPDFCFKHNYRIAEPSHKEQVIESTIDMLKLVVFSGGFNASKDHITEILEKAYDAGYLSMPKGDK